MREGTHNTMSYKKPKQWWAKILRFCARCQSKDYKTQFELGTQAFDLRFYWDEEGNFEFRHGSWRYDGSDLYEILDFCNEHAMYVRVMLENRGYRKHAFECLEQFQTLCKEIETKYPNITFYGGRDLYNWEIQYDFKNDVTEYEFHASVTNLFPNIPFLKKIDDWCPWFYAKLKNHKVRQENREKYKTEDCIILYDFININ